MILLIYGGGALGRKVYDLTQRNYPARWEKIIFINDFPQTGGASERHLFEYLTFNEVSEKFKNNFSEVEAVVAVGEPRDREILYQKLKNAEIKIATLIDKTSKISPTAKIGEGTIINEFSTVHSQAIIAQNVLIDTFCKISHDIKIGSHSVISANAALGGRIIFGERVFVGMGAALKENISIGNDAVIGMGSVVLKSVENCVTVVGNPARVLTNSAQKVFKH